MSAGASRRENKQTEDKGQDLCKGQTTCCSSKASGQEYRDAPEHKGSIRNLHEGIGRRAVARNKQGVHEVGPARWECAKGKDAQTAGRLGGIG